MLADIELALAELAPILAGLYRLEGALQRLKAASVQNQMSDFPPCTVPVTEHRRMHRTGMQAKLDADPELQAFVLARLDRLTFKSIADEVADYFPPARCVGRSAIHEWARRRVRRAADGSGLPG